MEKTLKASGHWVCAEVYRANHSALMLVASSFRGAQWPPANLTRMHWIPKSSTLNPLVLNFCQKNKEAMGVFITIPIPSSADEQ